MPVWSKLKSGRIPQGDELFDIIGNQLNLSKSGTLDPSNQFKSNNNNNPPPQMHNEEPSTQEYDSPERDDFEEFDGEEKEEL